MRRRGDHTTDDPLLSTETSETRRPAAVALAEPLVAGETPRHRDSFRALLFVFLGLRVRHTCSAQLVTVCRGRAVDPPLLLHYNAVIINCNNTGKEKKSDAENGTQIRGNNVCVLFDCSRYSGTGLDGHFDKGKLMMRRRQKSL